MSAIQKIIKGILAELEHHTAETVRTELRTALRALESTQYHSDQEAIALAIFSSQEDEEAEADA